MELEQNTLASTGMFGGQPHRWLEGNSALILFLRFTPKTWNTIYIYYILDIYIYIYYPHIYIVYIISYIYICHTRFLILNIQTQLAWRRRATQRARYHISSLFHVPWSTQVQQEWRTCFGFCCLACSSKCLSKWYPVQMALHCSIAFATIVTYPMQNLGCGATRF